jgi:hypothetical protein
MEAASPPKSGCEVDIAKRPGRADTGLTCPQQTASRVDSRARLICAVLIGRRFARKVSRSDRLRSDAAAIFQSYLKKWIVALKLPYLRS